jgi:hypothetical protein
VTAGNSTKPLVLIETVNEAELKEVVAIYYFILV